MLLIHSLFIAILSKHISSQTRLDSASNKISPQIEVMDNHRNETTETTTSIKSRKRKQSIALAPKRLFSRTKAYFKKKSGRSCKQGTQILDTGEMRSRHIEQLYKAMTV